MQGRCPLAILKLQASQFTDQQLQHFCVVWQRLLPGAGHQQQAAQRIVAESVLCQRVYSQKSMRQLFTEPTKSDLPQRR